MSRLRSNPTLQFSLIALSLSLLGALVIAAYVSSRLDHDVDLLREHGSAMMSGDLKAEDPFSIPSILKDVEEVRWTTFVVTGGVLATVYLSVVAIVWRGAAAIRRQHESQREAELLRLQNEELRELDDLKSEFVATTSHEFRTPLAGINGFAEVLLESDGLTSDQREWVGWIHAEGQRLTGIVATLLDLTSIDRGSLELNLETVDLEEMMQLVGLSVSRRSERHIFEFVGAAGIEVRADRERLIQVLGNLVDNAVKYSPNGGRVTVAAERLDGVVRVSVSDEGIGIPAEHVARVFDRFHRIDRPETAAIRGTGLGLYLVRSYVEGMGGEVEVARSEPGDTTLSFTIPLADPAIERAA